MRKFLLIGLAATAILTGCSNDDTVEMAPQKAIGFETFVNKSTRANNDLTNLTLDKFAVYGIMTKDGTTTYKVLGNEKVSRPTTASDISNDNGGTAWTYTSTQYWNEGYTYWFSAIAPWNGNWTFGNENAEDKTYGFTNPSSTYGHITRTLTFDNEAAQGKEDLIYSEADDVRGSDHTSGQNDKVAFSFKHLLSRLKFTFNNNVGEQYVLQVEDLKIQAKAKGNSTVAIYKSGTYTTSRTLSERNGSWSSYGTYNFDLAFDSQYVYQTGTGDNKIYNADKRGEIIEDHRYIIPHDDNQKITIVCSFTLYARRLGTDETDYSLDFPRPAGATQAAAKKCENVEIEINGGFRQGYSYNFIANITADEIQDNLVPIEFIVTSVDNWVDGSHDETKVEVPDQKASNN